MNTINYLRICFYTMLFVIPGYCFAENASVSVFMFLKGEPLNNIQIFESNDKLSMTDTLGNARFSLAPGEYKLVFKSQNDLVYEHEIQLQENEIVQLLIDFKVIEEDPIIDIESSKPKKNGTNLENKNTNDGPKTITVFSGNVISAEDKQPVAGARIFISGQADYLLTDEKGNFSVEIPVGTYNISVLQAQYNSQIKNNVNMTEAGPNTLTLELTPAGSELPEFVVVEPFIEGSLASVLEERKSNNSVANYLSMEQISKSGDSDAAGALKRVTGLTLVDGKFIFIRGLGERYSSTLLNGVNVPSPDPTRRVVPLDLFPTGIIESIEVQKGYSPSLPAEFGGGSVVLKTINIPSDNFMDMSISYGHNSQTTGKNGLTTPGGRRDWTGYDDGTRAIPADLAEAIAGDVALFEKTPFFPEGFEPEELEALGESLNNSYSLYHQKIDPNLGFGLSGGMRHEMQSGPTIGFSSAFEYGSDYATRYENKKNYTATGSGELILDSDQNTTRTTRDITASGFITGGIEFNEQHKVSSNIMLLRSTQDFLEEVVGFSEEIINFSRDSEIRWTERQLRAFQLFGEHIYPQFNGLTAQWRYADSTANFDEPDTREYSYDRTEEGDFLFSTSSTSNSRIYSTLQDSSRNIRYDLSLPISIGKKNDILFKFGQNWLNQGRDSDIRRFAFETSGSLIGQINRRLPLEEILGPQYIDPDGYLLIETTRQTDNYFADMSIKASYINLDYSYDEWLRVSIGVRQESFNQSVTTFKLFNPDNEPDVSQLSDSSLFPALSTTLELKGDNQIRFNYAETATRPDFKELSTAIFKDPVLNRDVQGNENLITGTIEHYDLRWDKYFSPAEFVSVSLFYKKFTNPIEIIIQPGATSSLISFENAASAENVGIELEVYKDFSFLGERFSDFYVSSNYARIESEINLGDSGGVQTNTERPLQGQSPYVANLQIGYDNKNKNISASLLYNIFGERISETGVNDQPDIYEQPFNQLDFVYSQKLYDRWKVGLKIKNILDDEVEYQQGDKTTRSYQKGRSFSLGLSYDLF